LVADSEVALQQVSGPYTGRPINPKEAIRLLRGEGCYVDDIHYGSNSSCYYLGIVRSPYAHARITNIDASRVTRDAKLVILPSDIQRKFGDIPLLPVVPYPGIKLVKQPTIGFPIASYPGQPVAAVVAKDRYEAEDLIEQVRVDYEPLEPIIDPQKAIEPGSPLVHEELGSNVCMDLMFKGGQDIDSVFESADIVLEDSLSCHRVAANPIEPRGCLFSWSGSKLEANISCSNVFGLHSQLSEIFGLEPNKVRVVQPDVGGAFGSKGAMYPEYILAGYATIALGKPVKWIETRTENLTATHQGRSSSAHVSIAAKKDGTVIGIRGKVLVDLGAFTWYLNPQYGPFVAQQFTGPYKIPSASVHLLCALTNKVPSGPFRGNGRPEAAFFYERMMDLLASQLNMDPMEIRFKNLIDVNQMPYKMPLGLTLYKEDYKQIMSKGIQFFDYDKLREEVARKKRAGICTGLGIANYIEINRAAMGEWTTAKLLEDGTVLLVTGTSSVGQFHVTWLKQLVADSMGVDFSLISIKGGDSSIVEKGIGTFGSRSAVIGGASALQACEELKKKIAIEASKLLSVEEDLLVYSKGQIITKKGSSRSVNVSLKELAHKLRSPLDATVFSKGHDIFSYGLHLALVEVDRETGRAKILKYIAVDDAGRVINPLFTEGQIHGGVTQGIGEVLFEEIVYDRENGQLLTGSIGDAGVLTAVEVPEIESYLVEFPSEYPHGSRGVGEAGPIGAVSSLVSAIDAALGRRIRTTAFKASLLL
jgi:carbon-monoxide dehydrogenase large subunit